MIRVTLIHVGDFRESYLREAQREYEKRLSAFCNFRCVCVKEEDTGDGSPAEIEKALRKEGRHIEALIPRRAYVYALCVEGESCSSEAWAATNDRGAKYYGERGFVIGSSHGLCDAVKRAADKRLSFSPMTLPHRLMRVVLTEQIYRAMTIMHHRAYHK